MKRSPMLAPLLAISGLAMAPPATGHGTAQGASDVTARHIVFPDTAEY